MLRVLWLCMVVGVLGLTLILGSAVVFERHGACEFLGVVMCFGGLFLAVSAPSWFASAVKIHVGTRIAHAAWQNAERGRGGKR